MQPITEKLFAYLMSNLSGEQFESLAKQAFTAAYGDEYVPLAGMHDGGADGVLMTAVYQGKKPRTFFQFSVTEEERAKTKIRKTVVALRGAGRDPQQLIYSTTQKLPKQDILIQEVFEEFQVLLSVRDYARLKQMVDTNPKVNASFLEFFSAEIKAITKNAEHLEGAVNHFIADPTVFAFLDYELKDRFSKDRLNAKIIDSLIYWALRETDPDANRFLTRAEISEAIKGIFPTATSQLLPHLDERLKDLSKRDAENNERIRYYREQDRFCLPYIMRKQLAERAVEEEQLQAEFYNSVEAKLNEICKEPLSADDLALGAQIIFASVHEYFVEQGLILSAYLSQKVDKLEISDQVVEAEVARVIEKSESKAKVSPTLVGDCLRVLRRVFYDPSDCQRRYLGYLSRTSLLFMTLQAAPRIIEYFNQLGGDFRLLVGTDMLVKAISEQYLPEHQRQVEGILKACGQLGATLVLTEPVLDEIFTHLHAVDLEYRNHYLPNEAYLTVEEVSECTRILIRTYYYARLIGKQRISWDKLINSLVDPGALRGKSEKGRHDLRGLLIQRFHMQYMDKEQMSVGIDSVGRDDLAQRLTASRGEKNAELSHNDALMAYAVYALRRKNNESAIYDGFGYRTWWLTKETHIMALTGLLVSKEGGVPYIMRPEFLLNFIALSPNAAHVRKSFLEFLPTTTGLQLGQHLKPETMHALLSGTVEFQELPPERRAVIISDKINRLKHDRYKQYISHIN